MGRYLVSMKCPGGMTWEDIEKGNDLWQKTLSDYSDVKELREFGNLSEGHFVSIFEAPSPDRIKEFFEGFDRVVRDSGQFPDMPESTDVSLDIWPIEMEMEGPNIIYKAELAKV